MDKGFYFTARKKLKLKNLKKLTPLIVPHGVQNMHQNLNNHILYHTRELAFHCSMIKQQLQKIQHDMAVLSDAIGCLNPGQMPSVALDQPLITLPKYVQQKWPQTHGKRRNMS